MTPNKELMSRAALKAISALRTKKNRDVTGQMLVEGKHPLEEALKAQVVFDAVYAIEGKTKAHELSVPLPIEITWVSETAMARMTSLDTPPLWLGVARQPKYDMNQCVSQKTPLWVILDGIQDPGNLGTIIRSAKAFGATGIMALPETCDPWSPKVVRSSAGLVFSLPVVQIDAASYQSGQWKRFFENASIPMAVTSSHREGVTTYEDFDYRQPLALVLGQEGRGVSDKLLTEPLCLYIPMEQGVESLNVAVSASIILAHAFHQRKVTV